MGSSYRHGGGRIRLFTNYMEQELLRGIETAALGTLSGISSHPNADFSKFMDRINDGVTGLFDGVPYIKQHKDNVPTVEELGRKKQVFYRMMVDRYGEDAVRDALKEQGVDLDYALGNKT